MGIVRYQQSPQRLGVVLRRCFASLAWLARTACGEPLRILCWTLWRGEYDERSKHGFPELVALWLFILSQPIALTVAEWGADERNVRTWRAYGVIAMLSIGAVSGIISSKRTSPDGKPYHAFDRSTVVFARWILVLSVALFIGSSYAMYRGQLPGQRFSVETPGQTGAPKAYQWNDAGRHREGMLVPIVLNTQTFPAGIPRQLDLVIKLDQPLNRHWEIVKVKGWVTEREGECEMTRPPFYKVPRRTRSDTQTWELERLQPSKSYELRIYLHQISGNRNVAADMQALQKGNCLRALFLSKPSK